MSCDEIDSICKELFDKLAELEGVDQVDSTLNIQRRARPARGRRASDSEAAGVAKAPCASHGFTVTRPARPPVPGAAAPASAAPARTWGHDQILPSAVWVDLSHMRPKLRPASDSVRRVRRWRANTMSM